MFMNTGGGGMTQQQTLQNQTNASVRHNNSYTHSHTQNHIHNTPQQHQQQPQQQYEHHQGPVTFVTYPFCNVTPSSHGDTRGIRVGMGGGQAGHVLYQTSYQPLSQPQSPHPTQQVGLHNAEQSLHYFTKSGPMPSHHMPHAPTQPHSQIRNMIAAVSHHRHPYMVTPNYFMSHAIQVIQQTRTSLIPNAAPQHPVAVANRFCMPPLLLGAAATAVTSQFPPAILTAATGMGQQPTLEPYTHMDGGIASATASQMSSEHTPTTTTTKQRKHAIPIINPDTLEIVTFEHRPKSPTKVQQTQTCIVSVESVSVQTDSDTSASITDGPSDAVISPPRSQSVTATGTDTMELQIQNVQQTQTCIVSVESVSVQTDSDTSASITDDASDAVISPHRSQSVTASGTDRMEHQIQNEAEENDDTDADTNEHQLDNEDDILDITDGNFGAACVNQDTHMNLLLVEPEKPVKVIASNDIIRTPQPAESDTEYSSKTESKVKSKDKKEEEEGDLKSKEIEEDPQPILSSSSHVTVSKKGRKNKRNAKPKEKNRKKLNKQNKCNITEGAEKQDSRIKIIRYTLEELKVISKCPASRKTPVIPCQKGDCISQLFVAGQPYHHINISDVSIATASTMPPKKKLEVIYINLSLTEKIKLSQCENAWQPKFLANNKENENIEEILKKVRGILNKLTSENFDALLKEMTSVKMNSQGEMQKVMLLIFEKTVSEPNFAQTYARFCKVLFEEVKGESKKLFNTLLITRLQTEFESNVNNADAKERKLQKIVIKMNEIANQQEKNELQAELDYQEQQFRRRAWGTVRFIGEMYKLHSLSADRVLQCVESLLKHENDEKLEYMCKLLTTVGGRLEGSDRESFSNNLRMNKIFTKIQTIVKEARDPNNKKIKICSRVRFMMQDLIDLRSKNWGQKSNTPSTSSHIAPRRRHTEERNNHNNNNSFFTGSMQRMSYGGYNSNKNNSRHNQTRSAKESSGSGNNYFVQKPPKSQYLGQREQQSIDLKKLNFSRGDETSQASTKLGNSSIYMWRTNADRQPHPPSDSQQMGRTSPKHLQVNPTRTNADRQPHQPSASQPMGRTSPKYLQVNPTYHQQQTYQQTKYWSVKNQNSAEDIKTILASSTKKDNQKLLNHLIEEYLDCLPSGSNRWQEEVLNTWRKANKKQQMCLLYYILMNYLHLANVKDLEQNACAKIIIYLMNCNAFNKTLFSQAYEQFGEEFPDLLMDVPNGWSYVFKFLGPIIHERLLSFDDIWQKNWHNDHPFTERFVIALVHYFTKEFGANYMRDLWHNKFKLDRGQMFMNDQQKWRQFVTTNKFQFLYDSKAKPEFI